MINIKFKTCALFMFFVCTLSANVELPLIGGKLTISIAVSPCHMQM